MEQAHGFDFDNKAERIAYTSIRLSKWSIEQARVVGKIQHRESTVLIWERLFRIKFTVNSFCMQLVEIEESELL